jgi:hypothetical protein
VNETTEWGIETQTFVDGPYDRVYGPMSEAEAREWMRRHDINVSRGLVPSDRLVTRTVSPWTPA